MIGADPDLAVSQSLNAIRNATRFSYERMTPDEESLKVPTLSLNVLMYSALIGPSDPSQSPHSTQH